MQDRKGIDPEVRGDWEGIKEVDGVIIRLYYVRKRSIFNKKNEKIPKNKFWRSSTLA